MSSTTQAEAQLQPFVPFPHNLVTVRIVRRRNRFVIEATRDNAPLLLHMPNTGRMQELLLPGTLGYAALDGGGERKTAGTLLLVRYEGRWVSVDARMPNRLFERCLEANYLSAFDGYDEWRSEAPWGRSRIDFKLSARDRPHYLVETKSCNLVEDGLAY